MRPLPPPVVLPLGSRPADWKRLRPLRFDRAKVQASLRSIDDVVEAWRALGFSPDPDRVFRRVAEEPRGRDWIDASQRARNSDGGADGLIRCAILDQAHPHTLDEAVAFAADIDVVVLVERWARAHGDAMKPWRSTPSPRRIAWRFLRADAEVPALPGDTNDRSLVYDCLEQALERAGRPPYGAGKPPPVLFDLWREASSLGLRVPAALEDPYFVNGALGAPTVPTAVRDARFADLPNPFEPLERIEMLGYTFETIDASAITLFAAPP